MTSYVGRNHDFNCTTDDPNATVSLWHNRGSGTWTEKHVTLNELALRGQVFTLLNLVLLDGGQYRCKATDQSGQTIQSSQVFLYVDAGVLITVILLFRAVFTCVVLVNVYYLMALTKSPSDGIIGWDDELNHGLSPA